MFISQFSFLLLRKLKKPLLSTEIKKKISTAEHFLPKDQKHESFYEYFILSAFSRVSAVCESFFLWVLWK
jgi:hypothetical protein